MDSGSYASPSISYTFAGFLFLSVFIIISYWIELLATTRVSRYFVFMLITLNLSALLVFPIVLVNKVKSDYLIANMLVTCTVTVFLKLVSFHHVFHDTRWMVLRLIKLKDKSEKIRVNEFE